MQILQELARVYAEAPEKIAQLQGLGEAYGRGRRRSPWQIAARFAARAARSSTPYRYGQGGLGAAQISPTLSLSFLWQQAQLGDDDALRAGVLVTADNICQGGLYDHLAGGFARYSVMQPGWCRILKKCSMTMPNSSTC